MTKKQDGLMRARTAFEWAILIVSIAAIGTMSVGLLVYSLNFKTTPPDLKVSVLSDGAQQNRFIIRVDNRGGTTAEDVVVEVSSGDEAQEVEFRAIPKGHVEEAHVEIEGSTKPEARVTAYKES